MPPKAHVAPDLRTVHGRFKASRLAAKYTWKAVARGLGVSWTTVRNWEIGHRGVPLEAVDWMARISGATLEWVLQGEGHGKAPRRLSEVAHVGFDGVRHEPRKSYPSHGRVALT